ncbi:hypothetical protein QVD17_15536 [Tagetes erecta]|uniref:Uncharacterized protein n=1 Tax=Tagetes erecta TaxID=13708 RepID=A0AAD8NZQ8_TARER|nr:hypothetical protein QVD17_15536 [Tagetes erecta]
MQVTIKPKDTNTFASASLDHTIKVWDYQTKACVQTLEGHTHNVYVVCFHHELPIIIIGSEDENMCSSCSGMEEKVHFKMLKTSR